MTMVSRFEEENIRIVRWCYFVAPRWDILLRSANHFFRFWGLGRLHEIAGAIGDGSTLAGHGFVVADSGCLSLAFWFHCIKIGVRCWSSIVEWKGGKSTAAHRGRFRFSLRVSIGCCCFGGHPSRVLSADIRSSILGDCCPWRGLLSVASLVLLAVIFGVNRSECRRNCARLTSAWRAT